VGEGTDNERVVVRDAGCRARDVTREGLPRGAKVIVTVTVFLFWLLAAALASGVHVWNMHGASVRCPAGYGVDRGGWAEPDLCAPPGGGDAVVAERVAYDVFDPWPSALITGAVIVGGSVLSVFVVARATGLRFASAAGLFVSCAAAIVVAAAGVHAAQ
jgi:hypothetical protein